jgi:hypothetical protein
MTECKFCKTPITWTKRGDKSVPLNIDGTDHRCKDGKIVSSGEKLPTHIGKLIMYAGNQAMLLLKDGKEHSYAITSEVLKDWQGCGFLLPAENHPDVWLEFSVDQKGFIRPGAKVVLCPEWAKTLTDPTNGEIKSPFKSGKEIFEQNLKEKIAESTAKPSGVADAMAAQATAEKAHIADMERISREAKEHQATMAKENAARKAAVNNPPQTAKEDTWTKERDEFNALLISTKRDGIEDLLVYLETETDFYIAPSSTKYHDANAGGLLHHSIRVYHNLVALSKTFSEDYPEDALIIIGLLHDLCKTNFYKLTKKQLPRKDDKGDLVYTDYGAKIWDDTLVYEIDDKLPLGHGEKSVILLQRHIKLTDTEIMGIRWHMMAYDDVKNSYAGNLAITNASDKFRIIPLMHIADLAASFLEMRKEDPTKEGAP